MSDNCSDEPIVKPRQQAPTGPASVQVGVRVDEHRHAPVLYVNWTLNADGESCDA